MKRNHALLLSILGISSLLTADVLIDMRFNEGSGNTALNQGSLANGTIVGSNRPAPAYTGSGTGVGGVGDALTWTSEQTGRANFFQSVDIADNSGTNNLSAWTFAVWWKSDGTFDNGLNDSNPLNGDRATLFATVSDHSSDAGIHIGLNNSFSTGPQYYIRMGDGSNSAAAFGGTDMNVSGRSTAFDDDWNFLAVTFDHSLGTDKVRIYKGDLNTGVSSMFLSSGAFDAITGTGVANPALAGISIGDGLGGFAAESSFYGELDNVYFADEALDVSALDQLRASAAIPEPSTLLLSLSACMAWLFYKRRR